MQSSVASKLPSLVLRRRSSYRRPLSYCRQFQPRLFLQTPEDQYSNSNSNSNSNDHGCIGIGIDHNNNNNNNNSHHHNSFRKQIHGTSCEQQQQQQQQQRHHYKRQPRRIHSTLASTSFWRGLHQAVRQGNGNHAEEIAEQVLRDFYRFSSQSQSSDADAVTEAVAGNRNGNGNEWMSHDYNYDYNNNGTLSIDSESGNAHAYAHASSSPSPLLLDSQIFSLVLQAWKNSDHGSMHSALRAHNLLIQMAALADQDVLCDPPTPEDYTAVLECWHRASEHDGDSDSNSDSDSNGNGNGNNNTTKPNSNSNGSGSGSGLSLIVQHAEELWTQMKERQRREAMTNKSEHFSIDEKAYELFASLLAGAGKAAQAEEVVREAVAQGQWQQHGYGYGGPNYALADPKSDGNSNNSSSSNNNNNTRAEDKHGTPRVGLNLCHAVLRAHLASKETRASERADAFLQQMVTDPALPNPTVDSYNLLLERWMMSSKATTRKRDVNANASVQIAGRIEDLIHQMKETSRIQPNLTSYQYGIDALARSGQAIRAETMLAHLVKDYLLQYDADLKPSIAPFQSVLWAYSRAATATGGPGHRRLADAAERAESILNNMKELSTLVDTYPTVWSYNIVLKCWANSRSPDAVARTMALYEELRSAQRERQEQQPRETDDGDDETTTTTTIQFEPESDPSAILPPEDLMPDTTTMNTVLNILSKGRDGALRTEQKLWEFYDAHVQDPKRNPRPDTIAFSTAINAWSNTPDADSPYRAEALLQKMIDLNNNDNNDNRKYKPDIVTYTNVMQSWIKSKKPEAPEKSEAILRDLQRMQRDGDKRMKPDAACWNSAISAWATAGNGERAEALFFEMVDGSKTPRSDGASPTSITLTNVLRAWVKTRSHHASDRAIALLAKMEQYYRDGILAVKPNGVNYSVVLDCLAYSRKSSTAERAETMLQRMEASDDPKMHPSVVSYNSVIKAWSYTRDPRSATKITALLRHLIDRSEANPEMRPNENTFGVILKFLADSDLPDKEQRARAIQNLMKKFLDREPKPWVMNEFKKCLSSSNQVERGSPLFVDRIDYNNNTQQQSQARSSELPKRHKDDTLDQPTKNSDITRSNTVATQCRERRANKRFSSEIRKKNLTFQPISGKPETDEEEFQSGTVGDNKFDVRDALVRVRLSGKTTLEPPKQRTTRYHDQEENHSFSFLVVDGESEYSCKVPDVDKNYTPDIRGGQFLNISYYWLCGEPVVVAMKDAVTGHEIPR